MPPPFNRSCLCLYVLGRRKGFSLTYFHCFSRCCQDRWCSFIEHFTQCCLPCSWVLCWSNLYVLLSYTLESSRYDFTLPLFKMKYWCLVMLDFASVLLTCASFFLCHDTTLYSVPLIYGPLWHWHIILTFWVWGSSKRGLRDSETPPHDFWPTRSFWSLCGPGNVVLLGFLGDGAYLGHSGGTGDRVLGLHLVIPGRPSGAKDWTRLSACKACVLALDHLSGPTMQFIFLVVVFLFPILFSWTTPRRTKSIILAQCSAVSSGSWGTIWKTKERSRWAEMCKASAFPAALYLWLPLCTIVLMSYCVV